MNRGKVVQLLEMQQQRNRANDQVEKARERERTIDARRRKLEVQYDEAVSTLTMKRNDLAGLNGIISLMVKAGAVGFVTEDGRIQEWVMPDGSRKNASMEEA